MAITHPSQPNSKLAQQSVFLRYWTTVGLGIQRYWIVIFGGLSYVGAAFLQQLFEPIFDWHHPKWLVLFGNIFGSVIVIITIIVLIFQARDARELISLRAERDRLQLLASGLGNDLFDVWHTHLSVWSKQLGFTGSERISLYKWSKDHFIMLGRYAENRSFSERGRGVYPENEGCIGQAWVSNDGFAAIDNLPDPKRDFAQYVLAQEQTCAMPSAVLQTLRMRPRSIAAFAIKDAADTRRTAVIVFESTKPDKLSTLNLGGFLQGERARQLTLLIEAMKNQEPSLELAAEEGF